MKRTGKRLITLGIAAAMAMTVLTGCTPSKGSAVLTVGTSTLSYAEANFYARYNQAMSELYAQYYGSTPETMWSQYIDTETTYEDSVKSTIREDLEEMMILEQNAADYEVELTDDEKTAITEAATAFIEGNSEETLEAMTADQDVVERVLTLVTIKNKMTTAMKAGVDTEISDEEALRKRLMYIEFSYTVTLYNTDSEDEEDDTLSDLVDSLSESTEGTEKSAAEEEAELAYEALAKATDEDTFTSIGEAAGYTVSSANIGEGVTTPSEAIVEAAMDMEVGKVSEPILDEDASAYYVVMLANDYDEDATETAKTTILSERETELYDELFEAMEEALTIKWNEKRWSKISFIKQGCVYAVEDDEEDEDSTAEEIEEAEETVLSTDTSLTAAEGDTVSISYVGTIDGVEFDGGTGSTDELVLGSDSMIPGFEDGIIGHHPGETFTIDVTFPEDYGVESLNGQAAQFEITLIGIYE